MSAPLFHAWHDNDLDAIHPSPDAGEMQSTGAGVENNSLPFFTMAEVAQQLTNGYWGGTSRAFDVAPGDILQVDLSGLSVDGQSMARSALTAWTAVSGIQFSETGNLEAASSTVSEDIDASSGVGTSYLLPVGSDFIGTLSTGSDLDAVAVSLSAGQKIVATLDGDATNGPPTERPVLRLMNASGVLIAENDDGLGHQNAITYTVPHTGTYYLEAGSVDNVYAGGYRLSLREAATGADIIFEDTQSGAFASTVVSGGFIQSASINIDANWAGGGDRIDGYYFQTYLHEIGHALGLGHAGNYNGGAVFGSDNHYLNDSWQATVMSYFHQVENTFIDASFAYAITPMAADIIAIQNLYGPATSQGGDTIYGQDGNSGTYLDDALGFSNPTAFTIFDTGGEDLLDYSGQSAHQVLDLREDGISNVAGKIGNLVIASGTIIENARTGTGNDTIYGNGANNGLAAGFGTDTVRAGAGNDAVEGESGDDDITGEVGFDFIEGGGGNDAISGDEGDDLIFGDDVTLATLTALFPAWDAPGDAQDMLDSGALIELWEDLLWDVFSIV